MQQRLKLTHPGTVYPPPRSTTHFIQQPTKKMVRSQKALPEMYKPYLCKLVGHDGAFAEWAHHSFIAVSSISRLLLETNKRVGSVARLSCWYPHENWHSRTRNWYVQYVHTSSSRIALHLLSSEGPWRHTVQQLCLCDSIRTRWQKGYRSGQSILDSCL
jgi:hypothetical protein